jgi:hypothetical protein
MNLFSNTCCVEGNEKDKQPGIRKDNNNKHEEKQIIRR